MAKPISYGTIVQCKAIGKYYYVDDWGYEDNKLLYYCLNLDKEFDPMLYDGAYAFSRNEITIQIKDPYIKLIIELKRRLEAV